MNRSGLFISHETCPSRAQKTVVYSRNNESHVQQGTEPLVTPAVNELLQVHNQTSTHWVLNLSVFWIISFLTSGSRVSVPSYPRGSSGSTACPRCRCSTPRSDWWNTPTPAWLCGGGWSSSSSWRQTRRKQEEAGGSRREEGGGRWGINIEMDKKRGQREDDGQDGQGQWGRVEGEDSGKVNK